MPFRISEFAYLMYNMHETLLLTSASVSVVVRRGHASASCKRW
jgi:hypothetical protein